MLKRSRVERSERIVEERAIRNRDSAQRSRQRKQDMISAIAAELDVSIEGVKFSESYQRILEGVQLLKSLLVEKDAIIESLRKGSEVAALGEEPLSPPAHSHSSSFVANVGFFLPRVVLPVSVTVPSGDVIRSAGPEVSEHDTAPLDLDTPRVVLPLPLAAVPSGDVIRAAGPLVSEPDTVTVDLDTFFSSGGSLEAQFSPFI